MTQGFFWGKRNKAGQRSIKDKSGRVIGHEGDANVFPPEPRKRVNAAEPKPPREPGKRGPSMAGRKTHLFNRFQQGNSWKAICECGKSAYSTKGKHEVMQSLRAKHGSNTYDFRETKEQRFQEKPRFKGGAGPETLPGLF